MIKCIQICDTFFNQNECDSQEDGPVAHFWVAVLPPKRGINTCYFIEPSDGAIYEVSQHPANTDAVKEKPLFLAQKEVSLKEMSEETTEEEGTNKESPVKEPKLPSNSLGQSSENLEENSFTVSKGTGRDSTNKVDSFQNKLMNSCDLGSAFPYLSVDAVFDHSNYWATLHPFASTTALDVSHLFKV